MLLFKHTACLLFSWLLVSVNTILYPCPDLVSPRDKAVFLIPKQTTTTWKQTVPRLVGYDFATASETTELGQLLLAWTWMQMLCSLTPPDISVGEGPLGWALGSIHATWPEEPQTESLGDSLVIVLQLSSPTQHTSPQYDFHCEDNAANIAKPMCFHFGNMLQGSE